MMLKALIVEQLDADGTLKTLKMAPGPSERIVVAFAHEYDEPKDGPFHFLDVEDERRFRENFAQCRARTLSRGNFRKVGEEYHVQGLRWSGIPTEQHSLSYYALSLPESAIPNRISITDPYRPGSEYKRSLRRDDDRRRYVIYLECTSRLGRFDFELNCDFVIDVKQFPLSAYTDENTSDQAWTSAQDEWRHWIESEQAEKIQGFFAHETKTNNNPWISGSFYLVALMSVTILLLAVARLVNVALFPIVVVGGLVAIGLLGALQLRNDTKLSEKSFLQLMALSYRQLPFISSKKT